MKRFVVAALISTQFALASFSVPVSAGIDAVAGDSLSGAPAEVVAIAEHGEQDDSIEPL